MLEASPSHLLRTSLSNCMHSEMHKRSITFNFPSWVPLLHVLTNSGLSAPHFLQQSRSLPFCLHSPSHEEDELVCLHCLTSQPTAVWPPLKLVLLKSPKPPHLPNQGKTSCSTLRGLPESAGLLIFLPSWNSASLSFPSFFSLPPPQLFSLALLFPISP